MENKALVPVQQALVPFYGHGVLSIRLSDDHVAIGHTALCRMLDLDRAGQIQRIRRDKELSEQLVLARVETTRGPRDMEFLIVEAIPRWVLGINFNKLAPEKRLLLIALKAEAFDVFYGYFFGANSGQAANPVLEEPPASPWELIYGGLDMLAAGMEGLEQQQQTMSRDIETLKGQCAEIQQWREERGMAGPAPQGARGLSMDHILQLTVLAEAMRNEIGEPIKAIYADLSSAFGVDYVNDIPDARWDAVKSWLWQRGRR